MMSGRRIAGMVLLSACLLIPASAAPVGGDSFFEKSANVEMSHAASSEAFSGVILVARGDKVLLRQAGGLADPARAIPNTVDTPFPLESLTKQFTAAAILLLAKDHKITLDDPIEKYYQTLPPTWNNITIKQLLTHSAGIVDCNPCKISSYRDYIDLSLAKPSAFPPGEGMLYSNAGYGLLAAVIERVTGQNYGQFIETNIFMPLHMAHSGSGVLPANGALGYIQNAGDTGWRAGQRAYLEFHTGFGNLYSTVDDMLLWVRALQNDTLLPRALRDAMFTDYGHQYGFGVRISEKFGQREIWHTGADAGAGYGAIEELFPEEGLTVIALFNNSGLTKNPVTLTVEGKAVTFRSTPARALVEDLESLYFTGKQPH
jgi:CubicO group peptidase (beta-lactamase class C family)